MIMRSQRHRGLITALILSCGGLTALALSTPAGAATGQCMGIVIDDGTGTTPVVQGADVTPDSTTDLEAMSSIGDVLTQNNSGLVCAINEYPVDGLADCLATGKHGTFFYWSYWQGDPTTNTWTYGPVGPGSHDVSAGEEYVEGWRYQDPGPDNPTAPPPRVTPAVAFARACTPTTTTTTSGGGGGGSSGGRGDGSGGSASNTAPTTQPTTAASSGGHPRRGGHAHAVETTTTSKSSAGAAPPAASVSTSTSTSGTAGTASHPTSQTSPTKLAASDNAGHGQSGGDPAQPIVIVALVIMALGGVAWFRWRRRPAEE
jgi:hypothetical protein